MCPLEATDPLFAACDTWGIVGHPASVSSEYRGDAYASHCGTGTLTGTQTFNSTNRNTQ